VVIWRAMNDTSTLARFDAQIRRSARPEEPGALVEADGAVMRYVSPDAQGSSWIIWSGLDERSADQAIAAQVAYFGSRRQQFEWKLYDYDQPADLGDRLLAAGFVPDAEEVLMVAETRHVCAPVPLPPGVRLESGTSQAVLEHLLTVNERVFGEDTGRMRRSLEARLGEDPPSVQLAVALAGDEPVSGARLEFPPGTDFAGLWGGGTVPQWRGRGLYRALVASRAALAAARGYRYVQVDALPTSQPILTRLGFTALARTTPYIWDPELAADPPRG
jgi:ribosomal protein S18 acetylase RimI-like enzyme